MLTLAEIPSFQKFSYSAQTARMAEFIIPNVVYRATVYRTGHPPKDKMLRPFFFEIGAKVKKNSEIKPPLIFLISHFFSGGSSYDPW